MKSTIEGPGPADRLDIGITVLSSSKGATDLGVIYCTRLGVFPQIMESWAWCVSLLLLIGEL